LINGALPRAGDAPFFFLRESLRSIQLEGVGSMPARIVPMIHVPEVAATADWYASMGFEIQGVNRECQDDEIDWALCGWE
jgi:hypothetical protein